MTRIVLGIVPVLIIAVGVWLSPALRPAIVETRTEGGKLQLLSPAVERQADGLVVRVSLDGVETPVRVIGIVAWMPEDVDDLDPETIERANSLLAGKRIGLVYPPGRQGRDAAGRLHAYVDMNGEDFGRRMIADGFAAHDANDAHPRADAYAVLESEARRASKGFWGRRR